VETSLVVIRRSEGIAVHAAVKKVEIGRKLLTFSKYLQVSGKL